MRPILIACLATVTLGAGQAYAQTRFDVGLRLGTTMASDEAPALASGRGTTYQTTFAWCV